MNSISFFKALLMRELNEKELSDKQMDIADEAPPYDEITGADFKKLRAKKKAGVNESDHEVAMAHNSLESIIKSATELKAKIGNDERNIPGWIQDHITNAENYIDQAAQGFHELDHHESDMDELPVGDEEVPMDDMALQSLMEKLLKDKKAK
jgi:hypothetical protein